MSVVPSQRFTKARPCPVCEGGENMPRGKGKRCSGFLSSDGRYAHCSRDEFAGALEPEPGTEPTTWAHRLEGECKCGASHGPARVWNGGAGGLGDELETYRYVDEQGRALFEVVRFEPKAFRQRRPDGVWGIGSTRRVLYRLDRVVVAIAAGETIYVCEGERDVHRLEREGLVATTNPMGAGHWRPEYTEQLAGAREVVVVADHDEPGIPSARTIADALDAAGVPIVRALMPPTPGYDISDHLDDFGELDELVPLDELEPEAERAGELGYVFVPFDDFAAVDEPGAVPLVAGPDGEAAIGEASENLAYGDGGVGKTTVLVDQACHFAAGVTWHGIVTPTRPLRVGWVEAEGPRPLFRVKLRRRLAAWDGPELGGRLVVLEHPWAKVNLADDEARALLAAQIAELELDLVVLGPLRAIGMEGAGNLADVNAFLALLRDVRERSGRRVAFLVIHHESKAGAVSGAWEGATDLLVHVQGTGRGLLRLYWQKARHSTALHQTTHRLRWTDDNAGRFELEDAEPDRAERVWGDLEQYVLEHGGTAWRAVEQAVEGTGEYLRRRRDQMLGDGVLVNAGTPNRMELWHHDDPVRPTLDASVSAVRHGADTVNVDTGDEGVGGERVGVSVRSTDTPTADTLTPPRPPAPGNDDEPLAERARSAP